MDNDIYLIGEVGNEITLQKVVDLVATTDKGKRLNVHIHSEGGSVYEGIAIYNYLKSLPQGCDTYAVGLVASIASIIILAGKSKQAYSQNNVLIHLPSAGMEGNASDFKLLANDLEKLEIKLAKIYEAETDFTYSEAIALMREDRMMTDEEVTKFGLVIKPYKAVAIYKEININKNQKKMNKQIQQLINVAKKLTGFKALLVKTADEKELDFYELEDGQVIEVGAKAYFDGNDAEGSFVMKDGETYVFESGELVEIMPKAEVVNEDKDATILALTEQLEALVNLSTTQQAEITANKSLIAGFKAKSKGAPVVEKVIEKQDVKKTGNASAISDLRNKFKK